MTARLVVAVDLGGTTMKGALVDPLGRALAVRTAQTPAAAGGAAVTEALLRFVSELAATAGPATVVGAGVVSPGQIDRASGVACGTRRISDGATCPCASCSATPSGFPL